MSDKKQSKESVISPPDSLGETIKNAGSMPPTWSTEKIFAENQPPSTPAKDSTKGMGSKSSD